MDFEIENEIHTDVLVTSNNCNHRKYFHYSKNTLHINPTVGTSICIWL